MTQAKFFSHIININCIINALKILIQIILNLVYLISSRKKIVFYVLKKDASHLSILKISETRQEMNTKSYLAKA